MHTALAPYLHHRQSLAGRFASTCDDDVLLSCIYSVRWDLGYRLNLPLVFGRINPTLIHQQTIQIAISLGLILEIVQIVLEVQLFKWISRAKVCKAIREFQTSI